MPRVAEDLTGKFYGELEVLSLDSIKPNGTRVWLCVCSCGNKRKVHSHNLKRGASRSCGCYHSEAVSGEARKRVRMRTAPQIKRPYYCAPDFISLIGLSVDRGAERRKKLGSHPSSRCKANAHNLCSGYTQRHYGLKFTCSCKCHGPVIPS